ncbi:hypothetical protein RRG08_032370 [Elysia crispata]|uniref:Uncharacterized protein n=1 Tax=Elysia crispata TaxID=231223 RepID=A0AAE1AGB0_9GAST|nr:hypothetical protein RRG08_032370 [Elysia crispata]
MLRASTQLCSETVRVVNGDKREHEGQSRTPLTSECSLELLVGVEKNGGWGEALPIDVIAPVMNDPKD